MLFFVFATLLLVVTNLLRIPWRGWWKYMDVLVRRLDRHIDVWKLKAFQMLEAACEEPGVVGLF